MTERAYYDFNSSLPFKAEIVERRSFDLRSIDLPYLDGRAALILDKTIFYPGGGGQPSDRGSINWFPLLDIIEEDGEIFHMVSAAGGDKLKTGPAELLLDLRRRREFSQLHTAQHLLSATILTRIGAATVSMHLGDENCSIDVDIAGIDDENLLAIEEALADIIEENHPVIIHLCPPEDLAAFPLRKPPPQNENEVIRVIEIEGHDIIACSGTHLRSTAEIGILRIYSAEKYKGMTRISFSAGRRLLRDSRLLRQNALIVSRSLSVPINETGQGILDFLEKTALSEKRLKELEEKALRLKAGELLRKLDEASLNNKIEDKPLVLVESYSEEGIDEIINIGKEALKEGGLKDGAFKEDGQNQQDQAQAVLILASQGDLKFAAFSSLRGFDLRSFLKEPFEKFGAKGGGGPSFFQGNFRTKENMSEFLLACAKKDIA